MGTSRILPARQMFFCKLPQSSVTEDKAAELCSLSLISRESICKYSSLPGAPHLGQLHYILQTAHWHLEAFIWSQKLGFIWVKICNNQRQNLALIDWILLIEFHWFRMQKMVWWVFTPNVICPGLIRHRGNHSVSTAQRHRRQHR